MASSIVQGHLSAPAGRQRQSLDELHINLWVMNLNKQQDDLHSIVKMSMNEAVYGFSVLESLQ
jgi:hypothetical protein